MLLYLLLSLSKMSIIIIYLCWCWFQWFIFIAMYFSSYEYTTIYLPIFLLVGIWIVSSFGLLNIKLL